MGERNFPFQDDDVFVRKIPPHRRNKSGRPTRGAFEGANGETSVFLKRLLAGEPVPGRDPGDDLREFPVKWVLDISLTKTALRIEQDIEHGGDAHFNIIGKVHIDFKDHLRDKSTRIAADNFDTLKK